MTTSPSPSRNRLLLAAILLSAWWAICWLAAGVYIDHEAAAAYRSETGHADHFTANLAKGYNRIISVRVGMPRLLARDPAIRRAVTRFDSSARTRAADEESRRQRWSADPTLAKTSRLLATAVQDLGLDALWLLDANGNCVAASNAGSERSLVGTHYGDRDYFKAARLGRNGYLVSVDRKLRGAGLSFYAPIIEAGRFVGVVVGGVELAPFANWFDQTDAFLTDRNGLIVLARDPAFVGQALPFAPVGRLDSATRQQLYQRQDIPTLDLARWGDARFPELLRIGGGKVPVMLRRQQVADGEPGLNVLWPLPQLVELERRRLLYTFSLGAIGSLLMLLVAAIYIHFLAQRAAREREFHTLVDQSPDIIVRYDRQLRRTYVNPSFERTLDIPATDAVGKRPGENAAYTPEAAAAYEAVLKQVLTTGKEACTQLEWTTAEGHEQCMHLRIVAELDWERRVVGLLAIARDILSLRQVQRQLEQSRASLQQLTAHREAVREEERRLVARELHEELGQVLAALRVNISILRLRLRDCKASIGEQTSVLLTLVDSAIQGVRTTVTALRPSALDIGIAAALCRQACDFTRLTQISCTTELDDEHAIALPDDKATTVFRIVEEALSNVARHAGASSVVIRLCRDDDTFRLEVADNGRGFVPAAVREKTFGLLGIRERTAMLGGQLDISSTPVDGTVITVRFPA